LEIATLALHDVRNHFADSFGLDCSHRSRSTGSVGNRPVNQTTRHTDARIHQITTAGSHLEALVQFSTGQRRHRLAAGNRHGLDGASYGPIIRELIRAAGESKRRILDQVRFTENSEILRALVQISESLDRAG